MGQQQEDWQRVDVRFDKENKKGKGIIKICEIIDLSIKIDFIKINVCVKRRVACAANYILLATQFS